MKYQLVCPNCGCEAFVFIEGMVPCEDSPTGLDSTGVMKICIGCGEEFGCCDLLKTVELSADEVELMKSKLKNYIEREIKKLVKECGYSPEQAEKEVIESFDHVN